MLGSIPRAAKSALALSKYQKPSLRLPERPIHEQMDQLLGTGSFHCEEHQNLMEKTKIISQSYSKEGTTEKAKLAKLESEQWHKYVQTRMQKLPKSFEITEETQAQLQKVWSVMLYRKQETIDASRMLDFHLEFADRYSFKVPIDEKSLVEMLHPYFGYMCKMPFAFNLAQLLDFYEYQIVAAYERSLGEELLAKQISAFNYFRWFDPEKRGWLGKQEFESVLTTLKFPKFENLQEVKDYFSWTLQNLPDEFQGMDSNNLMVRFQFVKSIFLDYNL